MPSKSRHTKKKIAGEVYSPQVFRVLEKKPDGTIELMKRIAPDEKVDLEDGKPNDFVIAYVQASMVRDD